MALKLSYYYVRRDLVAISVLETKLQTNKFLVENNNKWGFLFEFDPWGETVREIPFDRAWFFQHGWKVEVIDALSDRKYYGCVNVPRRRGIFI